MRLGKDVLAADLYTVLGVPRTATAAQIRRAYRLQVVISHPDIHGTNAEHRMVELNRAAFILMDVGRRAAYDQYRAHINRSASSGTDTAPAVPFYPWASPAAAIPPDAAFEDWVPPATVNRPIRLDAEFLTILSHLRGGPSRLVQSLWLWTGNCSPATHLALACTSVCLALLLIASARPRSLTNLYNDRSAQIACFPE